MSVIKDVVGMMRAKASSLIVGNKLKRKLVDSIGSGGDLGEKSFNKIDRTIGHMIMANKQEDAVKYAKEQRQKVWEQKNKSKRSTSDGMMLR